ncbi:hypothetical protein [Rhodococcus wratislaviensis]|uniref:Uncharacterized protein n=1 Tax=Rhodococcus wratislaviensis NBRC 100605 TaxID=1219028 RepID=X0QJ29_RHOWR|nr:hypothetical protein [Rhodococcus wratislaviensis]GAF51517.1 hypothetical protein RW1_125_00010 [Rhodococcus wratislaviensis NBRC 100605]
MLVFGEPYEATNGTGIVTVSNKSWGHRPEHPVGIYTINAENTMWTPAVDTSRHTLIGVCTGFAAAVIGTIAVLRRPPWPEMTERVMTALAQARISENRPR